MPAHYTPLPVVGAPLAPGGGVLAGLDRPRARPAARYGSIRRGRKDLPRVFAAPLKATALYAARSLPLDYRQPADSASPPAGPLLTERRMRCESPSPRPISETEAAPRPEFARPDGPAPPSRPPSVTSTSERMLPASLHYGTIAPSVTYEAVGSLGSVGSSVLAGGVLHRKVLNVERPQPSSYRSSRDPSTRAQRRIVQTLLVVSGAFYAVSFLAFYFLSLP